jgi:nicotinamide phosphoribosyltransferase
MDRNLILATDSYKSSHYLQYPPGMDGLFSYFESRGGKYDQTVFFGLQMLLESYLSKPICRHDIDEAEEFFLAHGEPFNREGWEYILKAHGGKLPVVIKAPNEGTVIPNRNVLMTVESTDPKVAWIVNYIETILVRVWYPITVATLSWHAKKSILEFLYRTSDNALAEIPFKLHDFGARGVSSGESATIGGAAHLVNFMGSDTVEAVSALNRLYKVPMAAFSIPAAEHSTITSWSRAGEGKAYENMLDQFGKPGKIFACVSDSYNLWDAIDNLWGAALRDKVIASGATVVIRPDSGTPHEVVLECLKRLEARFGAKRNTKGYKVLNHVRVIQGDGINPRSITEILAHAAKYEYSASNIAFGMGGGLLQQVDRDTLRFAYKASAIHFADKGWVGVNKDPATDHGKASKPGRLMLFSQSGEFYTGQDGDGWRDMARTELREYYRDGVITPPGKFEDIRNLAATALDKQVYKGVKL